MSPDPAEGTEPRRLRRVRDRMHDARLDVLLVSEPASVRWLSGFSGSAGFLLVEPGACSLITDFRYATQAAGETGDDVSVVVAADDMFEAVARRLSQHGPIRCAGFQDLDLTVRDRRGLGEACGSVIWEPAGLIVDELRARKDRAESERIERAIRMAETALAETLGSVAVGVTERELAAELAYRLRRAGSEGLAFEPIVASGPRSALPHASPGEDTLSEGDLLLLDFGAIADGYRSDMTRTFILGQAAPWQIEIHTAVRGAVERAVAATAAGVPARDVDRAAREAIVDAGFGDRFGHGTGHGVGLVVHELPRVNARSTDTLETGNVVTIEPGVYLPGRGGVRLEEVVLVEEDGCRVLTTYPLDLRELRPGQRVPCPNVRG